MAAEVEPVTVVDEDDVLMCRQCGIVGGESNELSFEERVQKAMAGGSLCIFCQDEERKEKHNYGAKCEAMVRGAFRDAKAQGPTALKSLGLLKKRGGPEYVQAVLIYNSRCQGVGRGSRRACFEWTQMRMAVEMKSTAKHGSKYLWITKGFYKWMRKRDHEETDLEAEASWFKTKDELPSAQKCTQTNRILFNVEDFVIFEDSRSTIEQTQFGGKVRP